MNPDIPSLSQPMDTKTGVTPDILGWQSHDGMMNFSLSDAHVHDFYEHTIIGDNFTVTDAIDQTPRDMLIME